MSNNLPLHLLRTYKPPAAKVRVGPAHDGGYVVVDGVPYDFFISCGIGGCLGFEVAMLNDHPDLRCLSFDGTIGDLPEEHPRLQWQKANVGSSEMGESNLNEHLRQGRHILLKMDIEGGEHRWAGDVCPELLSNIAQIVIEVHDLSEAVNWHVLHVLSRTHHLVHLHANNCGGTTAAGVPIVAELTYLRRDFFSSDPPEEDLHPIPSPLDQVNVPGYGPEIEIDLKVLINDNSSDLQSFKMNHNPQHEAS